MNSRPGKIRRDSFLIGFSTYRGMVTAATDWNEPAQRRTVRPGLAGSYEELFHAAGLRGFWLNRREVNEQSDLPPETER